MKKRVLLFLIYPFLVFSQSQIGSVINGESGNSRSGSSVSLSEDGKIVAIGAPWNNGANGLFTGHVRIYENIFGTWVQKGQDIDADTDESSFGRSVSISSNGNVVAVGAENYTSIYKIESSVWSKIGNSIDIEAGRTSVSLSSDGNIVAIGGILNQYSNGNTRIYENQSGNWVQIGNDIGSEGTGDRSGSSVSLSSDGNIVAIGAHKNKGYGFLTNSGHVRVFENQSGNWVQIGYDIDGEAEGDLSGQSVSLSSDGKIVAIGAPQNDGGGYNSGHVRVFENQSGNWVQIGQDINGILRGVLDNAYLFGKSVNLSNDGKIVAIGAPFSNINSKNSVGYSAIYKFNNNINDWIQIGGYIIGEGADDNLGAGVSLSSNGKIVAVGAPYNNNSNGGDSGHVRLYSIASELALIEVVDDINGNINGINIAAEQLNEIIGINGAIDGVNYTSALNAGVFENENNPTTLEIQTIINNVNASLNIADINLSYFRFYPNPVKDILTIELNSGLELKLVNIYNFHSQYIYSSKTTKIDVSNLSSGLYFIEVETNQGKSIKKIIIE